MDRQARLLKSGKLAFFFLHYLLTKHTQPSTKSSHRQRANSRQGDGVKMMGVKIHEVEAGEEKGNQSKNSRKKVKIEENVSILQK